MEFALLGPLDVRRSGRVVEVGAPRERLVLAVLLLNANRAVSSSRLVEIVWGDAPPATARHSLQVTMSRLRAALDNTGERRIVTQRPGYLVRVEPGELDVDRARTLAADAESAVARGDHPEAARLYAAAEALWRGQPLEEFAGLEWAETAAVALAHDHDRVVEGRIASRLALGQGADLVGELELLVRDNPARERLRGQLMLALYQSGRQADALGAYQDARGYLRDELGVDPGPELRELHQAILRHDASIPAPRSARQPGGTVRHGVADDDADAERRVVTILVASCDVVRPQMSQDPEEADTETVAFHAGFTRHVESTGGVVEELDVGGARASFGGGATDDHADRAIAAALQLRDDPTLVAVRIGVSSGEVLRRTTGMTGPEGVAGRTSAGRPVVHAIALAHDAAPGSVLVDAGVLAAARESYSVGPQRRLASGAITAHVLVARPEQRIERTLAGLHRGFLGRTHEISALAEDFGAAVRHGEPRLVAIVGDPGVGKSALLGQAGIRLSGDAAAPMVLTGQCVAYGHGITYRPLAEILRSILGVAEGEPAAQALDDMGEDAAALSPVFGTDSLEPVHPAAARERLGAAWVRLLGRLSAERPVVLLLEDVHWAEQPLLDLLDRVVREVAGPLLVVATARPELADGPWPSGRRSSTRWLDPLDERSVRELVDHLLGSPAPPGLSTVVVERAEGVPFFVEELLATLIERRVLIRADEGSWRYETSSDVDVLPHTIRSVLAARVDRLAPGQRSVLQTAAVIGRRFDGRVVRRLSGTVEPDFPALVERDLLRRRLTDDDDVGQHFEFKHALTRDVAYASLSRGSRAHLHAAVARDLEATATDDDDLAPILAHHLTLAVRDDDVALAWTGRESELESLRRSAVDWLIRAGRLCIARTAIDEGIVLLEQALAYGPPPDVQADAWRAIGRGHALRYDGPRCWAAMLRAVELYEDEPRKGAAYAELAMETVSRYGMMDMPDRALVTSWIDRAVELSDPASAARTQALIARTIWYPADAQASAGDAVTAAEQLGDPSLRAHAYCARAAVSYLAGDYADADAWSDRMLALVPALDDPDVIVDVYGGSVPSLLAQGRFDLARTYVSEHGAVAWTLSDHHRVHAVSMHLELDEVAADWERVREVTDRTVAIVEANAATPCQRNARSPLVCAYAALVAGDAVRATELEALAEEQALAGHSSILNPMRLRLAIQRGDLDAVRRLLAPEPPPPPWKHWYQLVTTTIRLSALCAVGDSAAVEREATPLLRPATYLEPFALESLGVVREEATLLEQAWSRYDDLGLPWHRDRVGAVLGRR